MKETDMRYLATVALLITLGASASSWRIDMAARSAEWRHGTGSVYITQAVWSFSGGYTPFPEDMLRRLGSDYWPEYDNLDYARHVSSDYEDLGWNILFVFDDPDNDILTANVDQRDPQWLCGDGSFQCGGVNLKLEVRVMPEVYTDGVPLPKIPDADRSSLPDDEKMKSKGFFPVEMFAIYSRADPLVGAPREFKPKVLAWTGADETVKRFCYWSTAENRNAMPGDPDRVLSPEARIVLRITSNGRWQSDAGDTLYFDIPIWRPINAVNKLDRWFCA